MEEMFTAFATFSQDMDLPVDIFQGQRTYMHDPLAVYASVASDLITLHHMHVHLAVRANVLRTLIDEEQQPNVRVCTDVNAVEFVDYWLDRVRCYRVQDCAGRIAHRATC